MHNFFSNSMDTFPFYRRRIAAYTQVSKNQNTLSNTPVEGGLSW